MSSGLSERTRWTVGIAFVLSIGAMVRYPGGTALDPTTVGYSLSENFLSDLGMTVAYDHRPNRLGAGLFVISLLLLVIGLGHAVVRIVRRLADHPAARGWARAGALSGLLACVAFAGVAVTPENRVMAVHVAFTLWGWRIVPIGAALLALASFRIPGLRARVGPAWLIMALLLAGYAAFLAWGPSLTTALGLVAQVIAQKVAAVVTLAALLFVSHEVDRWPIDAARQFLGRRETDSRAS
jgi:hypothetical protein